MTNAQVRAAAVIILLSASGAAAQNARLEVSRKPQMVECDGAPCFRLQVAAVDAQGEPMQLAADTRFTVFRGDQEIPVILARPVAAAAGDAAGTSSTTQTRRITLVLFDTSGSMNQRLRSGETKFTMARRQLERLFDTFRDGFDQMAIAPFDSLRVAERIRAAAFQSTRAGLRAQVNRLRPTPQGNTALFSAVKEGLQVLKPRTTEDAQISMVVFTDGMNDVGHPTDDPDLLAGPAGLQTVTQLAADTGVTVYTVGYGAPGVAFDEQAMQALAFPPPPKASNYFSASDEARLVDAFRNIERRGALAFRLLAGPIRERPAQLQGQSLVFRVTANNMSGESPRWLGVPMMVPPWEGVMTPEENAAFITTTDGGVDGPNPIVMRMLVLVTYGALLALLWFGLPRLFWPERYIPKPAVRAAGSGSSRPSPSRGAPPPRTTYSRPEVTISSTQPGYRGRPAAQPRREAAPGRIRPDGPPAAPRQREPLPPREATDATVFIPPPRKPGGDQ